MLSNLLLYRFLITNSLLAALAVALWWNGYVWPIFANDGSHITYAIAALFAVGWFGVAREIVVASSDLNTNKRIGAAPAIHAQRDKDLAKVHWLSAVSGWLVGFGLLGTVIGFSVSLSGIDQATVGEATGAQTAVASLMAGMQTALNTTILGASLAIWHEFNTNMLHTGLAIYWSDRIAAADGIGARELD